MSPRKSPARHIDDLRARIRHHEERYYALDDPEISDAEFDALMRDLAALEAAHPALVTADSPTQRVAGHPVDGFDTVVHAAQMLSLDNAYDEGELRAFDDRVRKGLQTTDAVAYVSEVKIDGLGIALTYEDGRLVRGVTRGDGLRGEDVTSNVRAIRAIPLQLTGAPVGRIDIRGEIYLPREAFERVNRERADAGEPGFANRRNSAAGTMRTLDPALVARRGLRAWMYQIVSEGHVASEEGSQLDRLRAWALPVEPHWRVCSDVEEVLAFCREWADRRSSLGFDMDGVVVKVANAGDRDTLGATAKFPRWAIAFKFPAEQATTRVLRIEVNVGRTGAVTPFAVLEPVRLAGSTIRMATLHNADEVARKDIRAGDVVLVEKGGDVIPKVVKPIASARDDRVGGLAPAPFVMPTRCPACETPLARDGDEVVWRCPNQRCPAKFRRALEHFTSRGAMRIEGVGEALADQLVSSGLVEGFADLYRLDAPRLEALDRMGKKSAANVLAQLERSKTNELWRLLFGLGIRHVGAGVAQVLARAFGSLEALAAAPVEQLEAVPDVGPVVAASVRSFFDEERTQALLAALREAGVRPMAAGASGVQSQALVGQTFVLTGALPSRSRDEARHAIEIRGGTVSSAVSKKTTWVLAGADPGSKLEKARALGVPVIDEAKFLELLDQ